MFQQNVHQDDRANFNPENPMWLIAAYQRAVGWFSVPHHEIPDNEVGLLMERALANKSWSDEISAAWIQQPLLQKVASIAGVMLITSIVGLIFFNAPTLFALSAGFLALVTHGYLSAHEQHRWESAALIAEESQALVQDLDESQQFFNTAVSRLNNASTTVANQNNALTETREQMDAQSTLIEQQTDVLVTINETVASEAQNLVTSQQTISTTLNTTVDALEAFNDVTVRATNDVTRMSSSLSQLSNSSHALRQSQTTLTQATNRFHLFASNPSGQVRGDIHPSIDAIRAELNEDDALIAQWQQAMNNQ